MRTVARAVLIDRGLRHWAIGLTMATCPEQPDAPEQVRRFVRYGSSPRGAQALVTAAKIKAASEGRASVAESDVRGVVHAVLRHRVILNFEGQAENISPDRLIDDVLDVVPRKN